MTETSFGHGGAVLLWQITMFLAAVVAVLLAANRLRLDSTIGYLVLGVLLGPHRYLTLETMTGMAASDEAALAALTKT
jgi:Kef-type K+ transport system membrane component KefB